jgi:homoserine dehydrogenase
MRSPLTVLKLGGSVLRSERDLASAVHEVYRHRRRGARVLCVVSAFHGETDALTATARDIDDAPPAHALVPLLATGELRAAALLTLALERAGLPARALDPATHGPRVVGDLVDARPVGLDRAAYGRAFARADVLVLPGFVGRARDGAAALLGRGGSDLSALFVAQRLDAQRCVLVKDVPGLFERDPALPGPPPRRYSSIGWERAAALGGRVLQPKALDFARAQRFSFEVTAFGCTTSTRVGACPDVLVAPTPPARPLRVALLGYGTVAGGVHARLAAHPERFEVVGALVRDPRRPRAGAPPLTSNAAELLAQHLDVVLELAGGVEPASGWMRRALRSRRHVVTANKAALAEHGAELDALARARGVRLLFSASVGGAVPCLAAARRAARRGLASFEGVLNGTSTFLLERMQAGAPYAAALDAARDAGLAEADPALDVDGTDAAQKLLLLARAAFGSAAAPRWLTRRGLAAVEPAQLRAAAADGRAVRLVAACHNTSAGLVASVAPRTLAPGDPLGATFGADCALRLTYADGTEELLRGRGAGRWPTTEAVLGDLFALEREEALVRVPQAQGA